MSKDKGKGKVNIEKWLGIITVAISIVALFFSWQSNRLSSQQANAQVIILDAAWNGGGYRATQNGQDATCKHIFRLTNLGGTSTALTSYKVKISFEQNELEFENSFPRIAKPDKLIPQIGNFEIYLLISTSQIDIPNLLDNKDVLEIPHPIEPYSTFDIQTAVNFSYDGIGNFESPRYNEPKSYYFDPSKLEGYTPIMLSYIFKTATGQEIKSPAVGCWYVKN